MKKRTLLLTVALLSCARLLSHAQQVIAPSGGSMTNGAVQANWTVGELITETFFTSPSVVSSGVNQPVLRLVTALENSYTENEISVFPNPVKQSLSINYNGPMPIELKVISSNGAILSNRSINENASELDFSKVANGIYFIQISFKEGKIITHKIVKQ
jgi:hypothetical protein